MSQINRKFASIFVVFAAIVVYQFSFLLAVAILVIAVFIYHGFQMSDLRVNVQNSNRAQRLVSSLYSWTETAVSAVTRKCKRLTIAGSESENRLSVQNFSNPLNSGIHQDYCSESENVAIYNRENIYQGSSLIKGTRISDKFQKTVISNSPVSVSEWHRKSSNTGTVSLNKLHNSMNRCESEKDSFSPRGSPWGYSLSPQQRSTATDVRPVQAVAGPLLASSRYNASRDSALYVDVNSPGFGTRLLKYHSEAAIHQPQYARPGQLPLVHLNTSPLPTLNSRNSQKVRAPVRVRIAPPSYDVSESRLFSRPDNQPVPERQAKSVIDVLKEISRKRIHTGDGGNEPKRHHRSDSSSSSSSSSSPAMVNGIILDQTPTGKRPREEDSPKLQKQTCKKTRNNEIYSSLSSSRNLCVGTKRKAADNWSRCSTPAPLGKHLKKSPHPNTPPTMEDVDVEFSEQYSQKQPESLLQVKHSEKNIKGALHGNSQSPVGCEIRNIEAKPSSSVSEEYHEEISNKSLPSKNHHGRLFVKAFSRGVANETENIKDTRRNGGTKPWKTHRTIDVDAITGEDIVGQDLEVGSRRLNSMFSVLQSTAPASVDSSKADVVDGPASKTDSSKPMSSILETKSDTPTINLVVDTPTSSVSEAASAKLEQNVITTAESPASSVPTFGVVQSPSPNPASPVVAKEKDPSVELLAPPPIATTPPVSLPNLASPVTSTAFSALAPNTVIPVTSQATPTAPPATSTPVQSNATVSSTAPLGIFGAASAATFTVPQQAEKPATTTTNFSFGANTMSNVASPLVPSPGFMMRTSTATAIPAMPTSSQLTTASPFTILSSTPVATSASNVTDTKPNVATSSVSGGFSFGATSVVTQPSSSGFSIPQTTSSTMAFGMNNTPTSTVVTPASTITSLPSMPTMTSTNANPVAAKPTFAFGATINPVTTTATPATTTSTSGGFNFQFGSSTQSTLAAPKPQEAPGGFKFSFGPNKEAASSPLNQPTVTPMAKPPTFGEGFAFGANLSSTNSQENKPMTFGTPTSLTPTLAAPASTPSAGGFNFTANTGASSALPKPTFGFGTSNQSTATSPPLGTPLPSGFSFGAKPAEPAGVAPAPAAPSLGSPFQFGSSSPAMPTASTLQPQQQQAQNMGILYSIGEATEQKPSVLGGGFSFGSTPSANMPALQASTPAFGQPSAPAFGAPNVNPLQSPPSSNPSLFQFGSGGGGVMAQPGMSSGGFNFGGVPATGAPSTGFNFNPSGPSATTPFQFGANPLQQGMQAPAMFSIGSGSTAPRSRPRNRRQK